MGCASTKRRTQCSGLGPIGELDLEGRRGRGRRGDSRRAPRPACGLTRRVLARGFDRLQRDADLRLAAGLGELFDGLPLAIAAQEVHARVDAGGVAAQHVVDQADRLDVLPPVDGRAQAQAGDGVGDRGLAGRLALMLDAHDLFGHGVRWRSGAPRARRAAASAARRTRARGAASARCRRRARRR